HPGGSKNLEAVKSCFDALRALGFEAISIEKMVAHGGGSKNLEAVKSCFDALRALGFEAISIEKMVAHGGGSKNLEAVKSCFDALRALGFEATSIEKMVAHDGGSKNLYVVEKCYQQLVDQGCHELIQGVIAANPENNIRHAKAVDHLKRAGLAGRAVFEEGLQEQLKGIIDLLAAEAMVELGDILPPAPNRKRARTDTLDLEGVESLSKLPSSLGIFSSSYRHCDAMDVVEEGDGLRFRL
ncbi:MAG: hypothetical protein ACYC0J_05070, partial [Gammaproteobacteria bacterium]